MTTFQLLISPLFLPSVLPFCPSASLLPIIQHIYGSPIDVNANSILHNRLSPILVFRNVYKENNLSSISHTWTKHNTTFRKISDFSEMLYIIHSGNTIAILKNPTLQSLLIGFHVFVLGGFGRLGDWGSFPPALIVYLGRRGGRKHIMYVKGIAERSGGSPHRFNDHHYSIHDLDSKAANSKNNL